MVDRLRIETTPRSRRIWAPRPTSRHCRVRKRLGASLLRVAGERHAGGAVAQVDQDAAPLLREAPQRRADRPASLEDVRHRVGAVQPHGEVAAVADAAVDEGEVLHGVEGRGVGVSGHLAPLGADGEGAEALHQLLAHLAVGDEVGDGDARQAVALAEGRRSRRPS